MTEQEGRPRLMVANLPKYCNAKAFKNMLIKFEVENVKKVKHTGKLGFVSFDTMEDYEKAFAILRNAEWKGVALKVERADEPKDNFKSNRNNDVKEPPTKAKMLAAVQPLAGLAYTEQLATKNEMCVDNLRSLAKQMRHANVDVACLENVLQPIVPSPLLDAYRFVTPSDNWTIARNKCELAIGYSTSDESTREAVVGFTNGRRSDDNRQVVWETDDCILIPDVMKKCAKTFQTYLRAQSLPVYDEPSKSGVYRMLTIRSFDIDLMMVVTITAKDGDEVSEQVKKDLIKEFGSGDEGGERDCERGFRVTSLYVAHIINTSDTPQYAHIYGAPYIYARMLTHRFRLSPDAFFQPNVKGAEAMYMTIGEMIKEGIAIQSKGEIKSEVKEDDGEPSAKKVKEEEIKEEVEESTTGGELTVKGDEGEDAKIVKKSDKTLLLDICCGTGTIGISLAQYADLVIGAEICAQAVFDARENATINGRSDKCKYIRGPAESTFRDLKYYLPTVTKDLDEWNVVGVVDPPRAGLHSKLIQALRQTKTLRTIVFCSCDPGAAMKNFVDLCRPKSNTWTDEPFTIRRIVPVDMFPHTKHYEWVLLMTR